MQILNTLANAYDTRKALQQQRDELAKKMEAQAKLVGDAGLSADTLQSSAAEWANLAKPERDKKIAEFAGEKKQQIAAINTYVDEYKKWASKKAIPLYAINIDQSLIAMENPDGEFASILSTAYSSATNLARCYENTGNNKLAQKANEISKKLRALDKDNTILKSDK
jgi:hypothetical protein